jgi:hypothetical protein
LAGVPGRAQELPLRAPAGVVLLFTVSFLAAPARARAQDAPAPPVLPGYLELSLRLGSVHRQTSPVMGAAALLGLTPGWRVGGAGFSLLERVDLEIPPPLQNLELHLGYAGLLVERSIASLSSASDSPPAALLLARLLVGAGNAEVRDSATGSRLHSDNFGVIEPTITVQAPLARLVSAGASAAYRMVGGVDGLAGIEEENLRGWSIGLLLGFGPF